MQLMAREVCLGTVALATLLAAPPVFGQTPSAATRLRSACLKDYQTYCDASARNSIHSACLRQYWTNLSRGCQQALREKQNSTDE